MRRNNIIRLDVYSKGFNAELFYVWDAITTYSIIIRRVPLYSRHRVVRWKNKTFMNRLIMSKYKHK